MSPPRHGRRARVRRQRQIFVFSLVALLFVTVFVVKDRYNPAASTSTTSAVGATSTLASTSPTFSGPSAVGMVALRLTEPATRTVPARILETTVRYPAVGALGGSIPGARPLRTGSPYPLVVFSQGFDILPEAYARLLNSWASAGYVVADPGYPFTSPNSPGGLVRSDIVHHPTDLSFVITSLLGDSAHGGGLLSHLINPSAIGVIGQSDGGDVSLASSSNTCCRDARIRAAVILSGAELSWFKGKYFATSGVPLLVVQGSADYTMNPVTCSVQLYNAAAQPKYYLSMIGQTHLSAYVPPGPAQRVVSRVTIDFLNAYLRHSSSAHRAIGLAGNVPGLATITSRTSLPPVAGTCPDAPNK